MLLKEFRVENVSGNETCRERLLVRVEQLVAEVPELCRVRSGQWPGECCKLSLTRVDVGCDDIVDGKTICDGFPDIISN